MRAIVETSLALLGILILSAVIGLTFVFAVTAVLDTLPCLTYDGGMYKGSEYQIFWECVPDAS